ncbi:hypothetical protein [Janthinobacterium sp. GW458P]|uniref:hypothetical protein n=1 Tax=Janthinobacterium sp. GW458P TaxID=1981504 RepID=UPI00111D3BE4|nr:hypothetical protein [Janthinobacterium sp. GW458P]MBE3025692.1 hypothetical protein [Janthinobacterium sp. GW458P]
MSIPIANAVPAPLTGQGNAPRHSEKQGRRPRGGAARAVTPGNIDVTIQRNDVSNMFQSFRLKH